MRASKARRMRRFLEAVADHLEDWEALETPGLFRVWEEETQYRKGQRVQYGGGLFRCLQDHESRPGEDPSDAAGLWERVQLGDPAPGEGGC